MARNRCPPARLPAGTARPAVGTRCRSRRRARAGARHAPTRRVPPPGRRCRGAGGRASPARKRGLVRRRQRRRGAVAHRQSGRRPSHRGCDLAGRHRCPKSSTAEPLFPHGPQSARNHPSRLSRNRTVRPRGANWRDRLERAGGRAWLLQSSCMRKTAPFDGAAAAIPPRFTAADPGQLHPAARTQYASWTAPGPNVNGPLRITRCVAFRPSSPAHLE